MADTSGSMTAANSRSFANLLSASPHPIPDVLLPSRALKSIDGEVYFLFSKEEIMKSAWGLSGIAVVSAMRKLRNAFVRLMSEEDFNKALSREVCDIDGVMYRPFHWTPNFSKEEELSVVPVWIFLPKGSKFLPPSILKSLIAPIGKYIRSDNSMKCATRIDGARPIVEKDGEEVAIFQSVDLHGIGSGDKAKDVELHVHLEVVSPVLDELGPVVSEVVGVLKAMDVVFAEVPIVSCSVVVDSKAMDVVLVEVPMVSTEVVPFIAHEEAAEKVLSGDGSDMANLLASLSDTEVVEGGRISNKDVVFDSEMLDLVKKKGEDIAMKVCSSKRDEQLDGIKNVFGFDCGFLNGAWDGNLMKCKISFVYAKCSSEQRRELWADLVMESNSSESWLVTGDFNIISSDGERRGGRPRPVVAMEEFNSWIHICGLLKLQFFGKSFSWCNGYAGRSRSWARLDRSLADQKFFVAFSDSVMRYLPLTSSDHALWLFLW
ncbi:uncharacterized protein LOC121253531 [Juglans microcarpa x Juglans regia]|uniref:uncharacterized protein LOC121253531 n=1 Tax=Juglans microcarpa x Juglans regia TaxID=2249226 RepID=UPI001B7F526D|nr:uncharacterized protein LOC121253531 [Juglans microcarpa x Juglans regia]